MVLDSQVILFNRRIAVTSFIIANWVQMVVIGISLNLRVRTACTSIRAIWNAIHLTILTNAVEKRPLRRPKVQLVRQRLQQPQQRWPLPWTSMTFARNQDWIQTLTFQEIALFTTLVVRHLTTLDIGSLLLVIAIKDWPLIPKLKFALGLWPSVIVPRGRANITSGPLLFSVISNLLMNALLASISDTKKNPCGKHFDPWLNVDKIKWGNTKRLKNTLVLFTLN